LSHECDDLSISSTSSQEATHIVRYWWSPNGNSPSEYVFQPDEFWFECRSLTCHECLCDPASPFDDCGSLPGGFCRHCPSLFGSKFSIHHHGPERLMTRRDSGESNTPSFGDAAQHCRSSPHCHTTFCPFVSKGPDTKVRQTAKVDRENRDQSIIPREIQMDLARQHV
jgi:hypothetical protein